MDQKKFGDLGSKKAEEDPWSVRKTSFQKSRSVDVAMDGSGSAANRFADYTTTAAAASANKTEEDIPDWKRRMLERQKKDKEKEEEEAKNRNFGFVPGTTLHSSYVNKSYDQDSRLTSWGSASNLRSSSYSNLAEAEDDSSSYRRSKEPSTESTRGSTSSYYSRQTSLEKKAEAELTPYEKYLQRKREQEKKDEEENKRKDEDKREEERKKERERRRQEERKKEEETEKERQRKREKEREERRLEEERKSKEEEDKEKRKRDERKKIEEETKAKSNSTNTWGRGSKTTPEPEAPKAASRWGVSSTKEDPQPTPTPKWGAKADEGAPKKKPWEKPSAAAKSTLPSLGEIGPKKTATTAPSSSTSSRKTSESDSEASVSISTKMASVQSDSDHENKTLKNQVDVLNNELKAVKSRNDVLERLQKDTKTPMTMDSAKAAEATSELMKAREKVREQDNNITMLSKEKKALSLKMKELESSLERRPQVSETQKTITELQTKLKFVERKCEDMSVENEELRSNVQNLEVELEEVQDNFREDEADEYRTLKRELENSAKNCRVLQFKLKKTEKSLTDMESDCKEAESKLKGMAGGANALENINKVRNLEKELETKNMQVSRLESELKSTRAAGGTGPRKGGPGPCLSRTGSVERNVEDQLLKDLQDSIERENDLKEQLNMAEDEATESRKKLSRLEDENETLSGQLKRMTSKKPGTRRSPSPYNRNAVTEKDEGISEDGDRKSVV